MIARSLLDQSDAGELRIFYSYARRDESWRQEIDRLLPQFEWDVAAVWQRTSLSLVRCLVV